MAFTLSNIPGFNDLPDAVLAAEKPALGMNLARISDNAAFGCVRPEIFFGIYKHGETVLTPISAVDGYAYGREELSYVWGNYTTVNPADGKRSGPGALWFMSWNVDQNNGAVYSQEWYRESEGYLPTHNAMTSDGVLAVFTIATRGKTSLTMTQQAAFIDHPDSDFAQDDALRTTPLTDLSRAAKFGVVNSEILYCGEFYNGQTVTPPASPVDGYQYDYSECLFQHCWVWTVQGPSFAVPDAALNQIHRIECAIDPMDGTVSLAVYHFNDIPIYTTHGRVAVFAFCSRTGGEIPLDRSGWTVTADSVNGSSVASNVLDGNGESYWLSANTMFPHWLAIDLGSAQTFRAVRYKMPQSVGGYVPFPTELEVYVSDDGTSWGSPIATAHWDWPYPPPFSPSVTASARRIGLPAPVTKRHVKIVVTDGYYGSGWLVPYQVPQATCSELNLMTAAPPISLSGGTLSTFAEIAANALAAGQELPEELMAQLNANIKYAACRPEFFQGSYTNGQTVPLPVSPLDGYHYSRAELQYIWEIASTGPEGSGMVRLQAYNAKVDPTTGVVSINIERLKVGGATAWTNEGSLKVTVVASRAAENAPWVDPLPAGPGGDDGTGSTGSYTSDWSVNGV